MMGRPMHRRNAWSTTRSILMAPILAIALLAGCTTARESSAGQDAGERSQKSATEFESRTIPIVDPVSYRGLGNWRPGTHSPGGAAENMPYVNTPLQRAFTEEIQANWIDPDYVFSISSKVDGTCPLMPTSMEVMSKNMIVVSMEQSRLPCTADLYRGPFTSEIDLPADVTGRPVTVAFRFLDEERKARYGESPSAWGVQHERLQ